MLQVTLERKKMDLTDIIVKPNEVLILKGDFFFSGVYLNRVEIFYQVGCSLFQEGTHIGFYTMKVTKIKRKIEEEKEVYIFVDEKGENVFSVQLLSEKRERRDLFLYHTSQKVLLKDDESYKKLFYVHEKNKKFIDDFKIEIKEKYTWEVVEVFEKTLKVKRGMLEKFVSKKDAIPFPAIKKHFNDLLKREKND